MEISIDKTVTNVLFLFLFPFALVSLKIVSISTEVLGGALFVSFIFLLLITINRQRIKNYQLAYYIPFFLFVIVYIINLVSYYTLSAVNNVLFFVVYAIVLFVVSNSIWEQVNIKKIAFLSVILYPILFYILFTEIEDINLNKVGIWAFILSFFPFLYIINSNSNFKKTKLLLLFSLVITTIQMSGTRSVLLSVIFSIFTLFVWKFISGHKKIFNFYFIMIMTFVALYTFIYPKLDVIFPNIYYPLQEFVANYTGKNLFSGRNELWMFLIDAIIDKPFFGHGSGIAASEFTNFDLTSHNLYLEITIQVGIIGVLLFVWFLYYTWKIFWANRYDKKVMLSAAYFIGIIIYQINETSFIKGDIGLCLIDWMIIGVGLSYCWGKIRTTN